MDPLSDAQKGKASPFLINVGTVNKSLAILRKAEKTLFAKTQDKTLRNDPVGPTCRILVRNDTGLTLLALSCVEIGDPTISAVNASFELMRHPMFAADTPTASDVAFAITEEPIPAGQYGRAVVLGVVPCDLNVTDTGHGYAAPVGGSTVLTSAATGPARILWSEGGTGTQKAVVLIDRQGSGGSVSGDSEVLSSTYSITGTDQDTGLSISIPSAGDYLIFSTIFGVQEPFSIGNPLPCLSAYLYDATAATIASPEVYFAFSATTAKEVNSSTSVMAVRSFTGSSTLKLYASRNGAFVRSDIIATDTNIGYVKLT